MAAPILYRWDDDEAPVARGQRDSLIEMLTACLVNGYGTKPAAGWTLEYVNVDKTMAAFRNNPITGTGFYLQVDGAGGKNDYEPHCQGFEVMTSFADGLLPFATLAQDMKISSAAGTTARPWVIIADDRAFYCFTWPTGTTTKIPSMTLFQSASMHFGDDIPLHSDDEFCCSLGAHQYGNVGALGPVSSLSGSAYSSNWYPRNRGGATGGINRCIVPAGGPAGSLSYMGGPPHGDYTDGDPIYIARPFFYDDETYKIRGWPAGLYQPLHKILNTPFTHLETRVVDGTTYLYMVVYQAGGNKGCVLISLDDWRV